MKKKDISSGAQFRIKDVDDLFWVDASVMELKKKVGQYWDFHANISEITTYGFHAQTRFLMMPIAVVVLFKNCTIHNPDEIQKNTTL